MIRRRLQIWLWCLLPFLAAHMLVPAGFMPQFANGHAQLVLCSLHADLQMQTTATPASLRALLSKQQGGAPGSHCLFSQAAAPALAWLPPPAAPLQLLLCGVQPMLVAALPRDCTPTSHRARGPPSTL
ncbi:hypothetical protein [Solimonas aquatica]|nr:hypothetical protein [Solimonas aquatica]